MTALLDDLAAPRTLVALAQSETLCTIDELWPRLEQRLAEGFSGELELRGEGGARVCLYDGGVAWVRCDDHPYHLGDVLRQELGLPEPLLRELVERCKLDGRRFGEALVEEALVEPHELRDCLRRHIAAQLWRLLHWSGSVVLREHPRPHRYAMTFELDELLEPLEALPAVELEHLQALLHGCRERLVGVRLAAVVEASTGEVLLGTGDDIELEAVQALCCAGLHRLAANRIASTAPVDLMLDHGDMCMVAHRMAWRPQWLLVLGGTCTLGRLLSVTPLADLPPLLPSAADGRDP